NSNLDLHGTSPTYENAGAPFADANPGFGNRFFPFHPMDFEQPADPLGPAETSEYGNGPRPKVGCFFSFERVFWSLSKPIIADIGSPTAEGFGIGPSGTVPQFNSNSADTGFLTANGAWGNR